MRWRSARTVADQFCLPEDQRVWRCRSQAGTGPATRPEIASPAVLLRISHYAA